MGFLKLGNSKYCNDTIHGGQLWDANQTSQLDQTTAPSETVASG
jgi:hypothetical protein